MKRNVVIVLLWTICASQILDASAEDLAVPQKSLILPGEVFAVKSHTAFVLLPPENLRQKPQPWVFYAPTLPGLPDAHEKWMHEQFLAAGVAVAGVDVGESYGSAKGSAAFAEFHAAMVGRGYATKACALGRSRGGLQLLSWACDHPEHVAGIAGIYPVFDLRSFPGLPQAAPAYGLTASELEAKLSELNPISRATVVAKAGVPVFLIHGDDDKVVPIEANSAALLNAYEAADQRERLKLEIAKGQGHNYWQGFFRCQPLIDFAIERARAGAK